MKDDRKALNLKIPVELYEKFVEQAKLEYITISQLLKKSAIEYLKSKGKL